MRIIFLGSGDFAIPTLKALHDAGHDIPLIITQPDRGSGRGRRTTPTPVKQAALELELPVVATNDVNEPALIERVQSDQPVVGVVVAFGQRIGQAFRSTIPGGCINLHASLLPNYRGAAPYQWAVIHGAPITGVTVFKIVQRMDAGPILTQEETPISEMETAAELHDRLAQLGPAAVADALQLFEGGQVPTGKPQDDAQATKAPKLAKHDGRFDFARPAAELVNFIHGMWSWPGACCRFVSADGVRNEGVTIARARAVDQQAVADPGTLNDQLQVAAGTGMIEILEIKPESGKLMNWPDYVNGRHVQPADRFAPLNE